MGLKAWMGHIEGSSRRDDQIIQQNGPQDTYKTWRQYGEFAGLLLKTDTQFLRISPCIPVRFSLKLPMGMIGFDCYAN